LVSDVYHMSKPTMDYWRDYFRDLRLDYHPSQLRVPLAWCQFLATLAMKPARGQN